jgi:hypothetical protein
VNGKVIGENIFPLAGVLLASKEVLSVQLHMREVTLLYQLFIQIALNIKNKPETVTIKKITLVEKFNS